MITPHKWTNGILRTRPTYPHDYFQNNFIIKEPAALIVLQEQRRSLFILWLFLDFSCFWLSTFNFVSMQQLPDVSWNHCFLLQNMWFGQSHLLQALRVDIIQTLSISKVFLLDHPNLFRSVCDSQIDSVINQPQEFTELWSKKDYLY